MALELKASSRWWYARLMANGKLRRFPLIEFRSGKAQRIEVKGRRPKSLKHPETGDAAFQESYRRALAAHDRLREEELSRRGAEELTQRLIETKIGTGIDFVKIEAAPDAWAAIPRMRPASAGYIEHGKKVLGRFVNYMRENFPNVRDLAEVRADQVRAFLDSEEKRGIAPRTWNVVLKRLKTLFAKLEPNADAYRAFLRTAVFKAEDTIHRQPFRDEDIEAILAAAREDEVMRGPIVTAICTAMRRGDCCLLKWSSVDLKGGFIEIRTGKTGERAEIPILPALREELERMPRTESEYVFPEAAEIYRADPWKIDHRLRAILKRAGFVDAKTAARLEKAKQIDTRPVLPPDETHKRGLDAIERSEMSAAKRARMRTIFTEYMDGKALRAIAKEHGFSKGTVSLHLNTIADMIGAAVIRPAPLPAGPVVIRGTTQKDGENGNRLRKGSVFGWHAFRTSFVTRALAGGMPEELVRRVTGHTAVEVAREHYFRPGRDEFRREFAKAMPDLLTNGAKTRDEKLREIIAQMEPRRLRMRALALLDGDKG